MALDRKFGANDNQLVVGLQARRDTAYLDRRHTKARQTLKYCEVQQPDGPTIPVPATHGACLADDVKLLDFGPYIVDTGR